MCLRVINVRRRAYLKHIADSGQMPSTFTLGLMIRKLIAIVGLVLLSVAFRAAASAAPVAKPNLVLITLESARADRLVFLGGKGAHTPNLNHLAAESIVFDHAYAQAPGTVVSHATLLSGSYPQSTGMSEIGGTLPSTLPFLPDLLKAHGYRTAAFVGSIALDPRNGLAQGFERGFQIYDAGFRPVSPGDLHPAITGRGAAEVVARATAWLDHNAKDPSPFFLWIHLNNESTAAASYNAAVTAADSAVGKLVAALKQQKIDGNTAVIVVASHGESLGAHGEDGHGIFLYDETIHVPLLIKLAEAQASSRQVTAKVRLVDVAPTVLEIAGVPVPSQMQGQSLLRVAKAGEAPISRFIRAAIPPSADLDGVPWNRGGRVNISISVRLNPSSTI